MGKADSRQGPHGIAVVDKAPGWTSHDVVAKARGILRTRKIGHAGTLDPDATGVLVLGVGDATRLLRFCTAMRKRYEAEIVFGVATSTLDAAGEVLDERDMRALTPDAVESAATRFVGDIEQVPPMVSAIKVGGRRLHELAREGIEVERSARPVTVHRFTLEPLEPEGPHPVYRAQVECSSGTYIRTLAADLGAALGGFAHLRALRRTAVGDFTLDVARPLEALDPDELLPVAAAVRGLDGVTVDDATAAAVAHGRMLPPDVFPAGSGPWPVFGAGGELLAVYEPHPRTGLCKPTVVLARGAPAERE
jgi:tRNA pseudouridine55 synthase